MGGFPWREVTISSRRKLCFDNGAVWSILVDTSGGEECWRYLPANEEQPQLVLYSDGIECE